MRIELFQQRAVYCFMVLEIIERQAVVGEPLQSFFKSLKPDIGVHQVRWSILILCKGGGLFVLLELAERFFSLFGNPECLDERLESFVA